jgi:hypothetical protein
MLRRASCVSALAPGWYLFGASPAAAAQSSSELQFDFELLLSRLHG